MRLGVTVIERPSGSPWSVEALWAVAISCDTPITTEDRTATVHLRPTAAWPLSQGAPNEP